MGKDASIEIGESCSKRVKDKMDGIIRSSRGLLDTSLMDTRVFYGCLTHLNHFKYIVVHTLLPPLYSIPSEL